MAKRFWFVFRVKGIFRGCKQSTKLFNDALRRLSGRSLALTNNSILLEDSDPNQCFCPVDSIDSRARPSPEEFTPFFNETIFLLDLPNIVAIFDTVVELALPVTAASPTIMPSLQTSREPSNRAPTKMPSVFPTESPSRSPTTNPDLQLICAWLDLSPTTCPIALSANPPSATATGSIPSQIGLLTNLSVLFLYNNLALTGSIPSQIGLLTSLNWLWLANNTLTGSIPSQIGLLTSELDGFAT